MIRPDSISPRPASSLSEQQFLERQVIRACFLDHGFTRDVSEILAGRDFVDAPMGPVFDFVVDKRESGDHEVQDLMFACHNAGLLSDLGGLQELGKILGEPGDTGHARVYAKMIAQYKRHAPRGSNSPVISALELFERFPKKRSPIIHGVLRRGETLNLIGASKAGKSWLITLLLLCIATGRNWLGHRVERGKVLLLDNELHPEELSSRIQRVARAMNISDGDIDGMLDVVTLRGRLMDIGDVRKLTESLSTAGYSLVAFDAFYRFLPAGLSENDNGAMAGLYNGIDSFAADLGCAVVLNHHSSKGDQSGKSVTDVGSGAGSMSRAADTHLVIRPHQREGYAVLDAVCRSWPPLEARSIRWEWPLWHASDIEPVLYQKPKPGARAAGSGGKALSYADADPFSSNFEDDGF